MENNRRFLLAVALSALALFAFQFLFPTPKTPAARPSAAVAPAGQPGAPTTPPSTPGVAAAAAAGAALPAPAASAETVTVAGPRAAYRVAAQGAALVGAEMTGYRNLHLGAARQREGQPPVQLARPGDALLSYRLVVAGDTVPLARVPFTVAPQGADGATGAVPAGAARVLRLDGQVPTRAGVVPVSLTYDVRPDSFALRVRGAVQAAGPAFLLVDLPPTIAPTERDTADHLNHLSFAWKPAAGSAKGEAFGGLDPGERRLVADSLSWAVAKSKYFLVGVLAPQGGRPFSELSLEGGVRTGKAATRARGTLVVPVANGGFGLDVYAGPQEWRRLVAQGRHFEDSNPYGGWLQGIVQPFATIAIRGVLWMHDTLRLSYGWVLVALGVLVRLVLWPLQQNMMRNQLKMQRIQPEMTLVQQRYKNDPQRMQQEMMAVYAAHGVSPFATITGCLPMLLPMPIFFALFFVFQNTIEFRGVPFLWMADISLKDPFYVLPVLVAATQFLISWIGMRGQPPNPQTQMLTYFMPAMFLVFFVNVAAGLNLYYLTQNLVMIPQQWLLARERVKAGGTPTAPVVQGTPTRPAKPAKERLA